ncbi:DUF2017 domain-containing protein [Aeromicrobium duanguangcaii]|uniref:DUF2017 domain-containing protein n=1 Tax=Aeromicrobium duanguangcaii TaxID=2968086 RepID=A0ABY5KBS3_9ACTN|nr:DUF2017 domain-containing protein [Aeromicrobium duanguangcaii]MCD9154684.1 DUF2017 domain-containing protein [Aeromicrobium duanguangcaii]UUI67902.1 DUF2017 domain-containing protein [Aeromicrobium duanguangcaii]
MKPFRRRRRGTVTATFELNEAQLLVNLASQVVELLQDRNGPSESEPDPLAQMIGMTGPALPPEDPVLARLLPDAYRDDPQESAEFRRFTEQSLSSGKVANAHVVIESLEDGGLDVGAKHVEVELDEPQVMAWLRALTDIRIALAVRLGIETEEDAERLAESDDEATLAMGDVFDWLGYVQETLVNVA